MTCIIGLVHDGNVYMGGDSAGSTDWVTYTVTHPKVFRLGNFLIGFTTSFRFGQLLQTQLTIPKPDNGKRDEVFMIVDFAESVRTLLKEYGYATIESNRETGGTALIGVNGRLYELLGDYSVLEFTNQFAAVGSGQEFALGAMHVLSDAPPKRRIKRALEAAAYFSPGVKPPFHIEVMKT